MVFHMGDGRGPSSWMETTTKMRIDAPGQFEPNRGAAVPSSVNRLRSKLPCLIPLEGDGEVYRD